MKSQKRHAAIRGTFPQKLSYVHGSYRVKRTGNGKAIFVYRKVLVWVIPHLKLQPEKAKNIEETENTYSDEGLNVSNDIFVEGPEYLEVNI
ncbi:hypothetical protein RIR_jg28628.t2 [Rhizophagus irregularis DAOM 181602=DAOM 197198]|nr:hypothetical protein RIR_jg28628.t2 [Rhizophagus irregularis DAOM 181602=DAOM 197198]